MRLWPLPVALAQRGFIEFPCRQARKLGLEIDRARAFVVGEMVAAIGDQLALHFSAGREARRELHDRLDLLAHLLVGRAEHRGVGDLRMRDERLANFG